MLFAPIAGYYHANQACYICGETNNLADTEVQIVGEGVLGICRGCVLDLANTVGLQLEDTARYEALREECEEHKAARIDAEMTLAEVNRTIERVMQRRAQK